MKLVKTPRNFDILGDLAKKLRFRSFPGRSFESVVSAVMRALATHQTHHHEWVEPLIRLLLSPARSFSQVFCLGCPVLLPQDEVFMNSNSIWKRPKTEPSSWWFPLHFLFIIYLVILLMLIMAFLLSSLWPPSRLPVRILYHWAIGDTWKRGQ